MEKAKYNLELNSEVETIFKEIMSSSIDNKLIHTLSENINKKIFSDKEMICVFCSSILQQISKLIKEKKDNILLEPKNKELKNRYMQIKMLITNTIKMAPSDELKRVVIEKNWVFEIQRFCADNEGQIYEIIKELFAIYQLITLASEKLDAIFKNPLIIIREVLQIEFTMKDLQIEEFFNTIIKDEFIKALIIDIKQKEGIDNFKYLKSIIEQIENEISDSKKVWKKLKEWNKKVVIEDMSYCGLGDMRYDVNKLNDFLIKAAKYNLINKAN
jgi:hypothetical protein